MIVVTPGEPAGVGPDLVVQLAQDSRTIPLLIVCDADMLAERAIELGLNLSIDSNVENPTKKAGEITVLDVPLTNRCVSGVLDVANADAVVSALNVAIDGCLNDHYQALVTGPIQKSLIQESGRRFSGHTEHLAERCCVDEVVMMLASRDMRIALATTHIPLSLVAETITKELLERKLRIVLRSLQRTFSILKPRLLVSGLNPHAGESGHLGREEINIIEPVCSMLRDEGFNVEGPLPADTLFTNLSRRSADAVFVMYHDQGLPVLKYAAFGDAVNITLGLPFVRTSVDHGTALDIAGSGLADAGSFGAALTMAGRLTFDVADEI